MGLDDLDPKLMAAIPETGYLRRYVEFGWDATMSPPEFHLAAGLAQMAVLMGNRVVIRGPGAKTYPPHVWFALIGPAGAARKSSGIYLATSMLDEALGESRMLPTDVTREALWAALQERASGYMVWSEFAGFLSRARSEYMSGIKEDLCEWWDSPPEARRKLMKGDYLVRNPAVSILAGAVPDRLMELIREQDLFGGFFSRFMFVTQETPVPYRGLGWDGDERTLLMQDLKRHAFKHEELRGYATTVVGLNPEPRRAWEAYDQAVWESPESRDPFISGFMARSGIQALKLAFCYALGRGSLEPEVEDVSRAVAFVEYTRRHAAELVTEAEANSSKEGRDLRKVRGAIRALSHKASEGWVPQSDVLRKTRLRGRQLEEYLDTMEESGEVTRREVATSTNPRKEVRLT